VARMINFNNYTFFPFLRLNEDKCLYVCWNKEEGRWKYTRCRKSRGEKKCIIFISLICLLNCIKFYLIFCIKILLQWWSNIFFEQPSEKISVLLQSFVALSYCQKEKCTTVKKIATNEMYDYSRMACSAEERAFCSSDIDWTIYRGAS